MIPDPMAGRAPDVVIDIGELRYVTDISTGTGLAISPDGSQVAPDRQLLLFLTTACANRPDEAQEETLSMHPVKVLEMISRLASSLVLVVYGDGPEGDEGDEDDEPYVTV